MCPFKRPWLTDHENGNALSSAERPIYVDVRIARTRCRCPVRVIDLANTVSRNSKISPILTIFEPLPDVQLGYTPTGCYASSAGLTGFERLPL